MNLREIENQISNLRVRSYKYEKKVRELEDKVDQMYAERAKEWEDKLIEKCSRSDAEVGYMTAIIYFSEKESSWAEKFIGEMMNAGWAVDTDFDYPGFTATFTIGEQI